MSPQTTTIITAILSSVSAILVAWIGARGQKERKKNEEIRRKTEARAKVRERESRLSMDMMAALSELCDVICIAVTGGHTNGNVETAQKKVREAKDAYYAFLKDNAAHDIAKI